MKKGLLLFTLLFLISGISNAQIAINEIMASNGSTIADEDGDFEDWIELYNYSNEAINLLGFGLSDDYAQPFRWVFPDVTMLPGDFLLVWASNKNRTNPDGELHTNFAISASGEEILLTTPDGVRMDEIPPIPIPRDISYGRYPDGAEELLFFETPTPGFPNSGGSSGDQLSQPQFSNEPGFYPFSFWLELSHPDPNASIFYTTDGSEPDENSILYTEPIEITNRNNEPNGHSMVPTTTDDVWRAPVGVIEKATTIRARALKENYLASEVQTGTFFIENTFFTLPVLSITTNPDNFFSNETGIYVPGIFHEEGELLTGNYFQRGSEWERLTSFEWFEDGNRKFQQDLGIRIHGGYSRSHPMKSLRLYARNSYGSEYINFPVFKDYRFNQYKRLILRNSGNDFHANGVMFRDALMQSLIKGLNVETQAYRPSVVFLNGEFWGLHNIRERYDKHYLYRVYGIEEQYLDYLTGLREVEEGSDEHYNLMLSFLEDNDISIPENYSQLSEMMDIENFTDYFILNIFVTNTDWPQNNIDFWRYNGPVDFLNPKKDGRWRWLLFDTDFGFGMYSDSNSWEFNMMDYLTSDDPEVHTSPYWSTFLFRSLLQNETFRNYFILRFSDLLNTRFKSENVKEKILELSQTIDEVMDFHIQRWQYPLNKADWYANVSQLNDFADFRPAIKWQHLKEFFELDEIIQIELIIQGSGLENLVLNTKTLTEQVAEFNALKQSGSILLNHFKNIPFTLDASAFPGFEAIYIINGETFTDSVLEIIPEENVSIIIQIQEIEDAFADAIPEAFLVDEDFSFTFDFWSPDAAPASYPDNMIFVYMDELDPGLDAEIEGFTSGAYNLDSRTRINGENELGFCFINTGNETGNPGYPGVKLGGAVLALETREIDELYVTWTGLTKTPNSREYNLRLQYRIGDEGSFRDVLLPDGSPVEYIRNEEEGHSQEIGPVRLPSHLTSKPYVQLLWRYYHTGVRNDDSSGARDQLCISNIRVEGQKASPIDVPPDLPATVVLKQNYPNPFNPSTIIRFRLEEAMHARVSVYTITGRLLNVLEDRFFNAGGHQILFDGSQLSSGVYLYMIEADGTILSRKMMLIK